MFADSDPKTFNEAIDQEEWETAINKELESHNKLGTWEKSKLPEGKRAVDTTWVFKTKENGLKKARLVPKGYQQYGEESMYAPVARLSTIRMVLSLAIHNGWEIKQLDVPTAFLNGKLKTEVYIKPPEGIQEKEGIVYKLKRALYGLKEAPKCWNETFNTFAANQGFSRSKSDYCLYKRDKTIMVIYVDDILITGEQIKETAELLKNQFGTRDLGELKEFLGMEFTRGENTLRISQKKQINKVLKIFGMEDSKGAKTPMEANFRVDPEAQIIKVLYREIIGGLMYISMGTRPDITYAVSYLSRFLDKPSQDTWVAAKRILRYLKETKGLCLTYTKHNSKSLIGFSDSDCGGEVKDRKSVTGGAIFFNNDLVEWISRKQQCVALSSTEAEYIASALVSSE